MSRSQRFQRYQIYMWILIIIIVNWKEKYSWEIVYVFHSYFDFEYFNYGVINPILIIGRHLKSLGQTTWNFKPDDLWAIITLIFCNFNKPNPKARGFNKRPYTDLICCHMISYPVGNVIKLIQANNVVWLKDKKLDNNEWKLIKIVFLSVLVVSCDRFKLNRSKQTQLSCLGDAYY